jgi:hypothetical protein
LHNTDENYHLVIWPTINLRSVEILGFLYCGVAEDSSLLGHVALFGMSLNKQHNNTLAKNPMFKTYEPLKLCTSSQDPAHFISRPSH